MAERVEETETEAGTSAPDLSAAAALAVGLKRSRPKASAGQDAKLDAFLEKQGRLTDLQTEHLHEQRVVILSNLKLRRINEGIKALLQSVTVLVGLAVVAALAAMAWNASRDHDLVVDPFNVPPDMAARGLTGLVVASELLDKFGQMQAATLPTAQTEGVYRLEVGDNVRIAIPETGVSVGELDHYLRNWLGHEVHVGGEIVRTPSGLALTVRYGGKPGIQKIGADADFDGLMTKAAEGLYSMAQPLRYGDYLADQNRFVEAIAVLKPLSVSGSPIDRARVLTSWAEALDFDGRGREALPIADEAARLDPDGSFAWAVVSDAQVELGHDEAAHSAEVRMISTAPRTWSRAQLASSELAYLPYYIAQRRDGHAGDFQAAGKDWDGWFATRGTGLAAINEGMKLLDFAPQRAAAHDLLAARQAVASAAGVSNDQPRFTAFANAIIGYYAGDWRAVVDDGALLEVAADDPYGFAWQSVQVRPLRAIAMARLGDTVGADALISETPIDCDLCTRARGQIAAVEHDWSAVDYWCGLVASRSPSIPFADADWGAALLQKGDIAGAIGKFRQANAISPHFADPLEGWGEALMAKHDYAGAINKFAEGDKDAPKWGRNHLLWGEALMLSGRYAEARAQYEAANGMDLSKPDRAALNVLLARTASGPLHG